MAPRRQPLASAGRPKRPSLHRVRLSAAQASRAPPYYSSAEIYRELLANQGGSSSPPPDSQSAVLNINTGPGDQSLTPLDATVRSPPPVYPPTPTPTNHPPLPASISTPEFNRGSFQSSHRSLSSLDLDKKPLPAIGDDSDSETDRTSAVPSYGVGRYGLSPLGRESKSSKGRYSRAPAAEDDTDHPLAQSADHPYYFTSPLTPSRTSLNIPPYSPIALNLPSPGSNTTLHSHSRPSPASLRRPYSIHPGPVQPHTAADDGVHPFFPESFERPLYLNFMLHVLLCFVAFPIIFLIPSSRSFQGLSIFWIRVVSGICSSSAGLMLGFSLMVMATYALEATVWATVIHESTVGSNSGIPLKDFARYNYDPLSVVTAVLLLYRRMTEYRGSKRRNRSYDAYPWNLTIIFYLLVMALAASLPFLFARLITISTSTARQTEQFSRTVVIGDLSPADVARASVQSGAFTDFVRTWTFSPFGLTSQLPRPVRLPIPTFNYTSFISHPYSSTPLPSGPVKRGDPQSLTDFDPDSHSYVYFAEIFTDQLSMSGNGFGSLDSFENRTGTSTGSLPPVVDTVGDDNKKTTGGLVRFPRWGIRVECDLLPNMDTNLVPQSPLGMTYALIPRATIAELMDRLGMNVPDTVPTSVNVTALMEGNDTWPGAIGDGIAYAGKWWNNSVAHSFFSQPISMGKDGNGWVQMESVLVRLNNTYTPNGSFGALGPLAPDGSGTRIGYDVAVCVEVAEPWILDAYNSTAGSPSTLAIVGRQSRSTLFPLSDNGKENDVPDDSMLNGVTTSLNSTGKWASWMVAHDNSRNSILKDNGRDFMYVPSPTVVSFTDGSGPNGYSRLSPAHLSASLGQADAVGLLPYLVGSQPILAITYTDRVLAFARADTKLLVPFLVLLLIVGFVATFFVPRLPLGLPRRDFGVFSWLAAIDVDELKKVIEKEEQERRGVVGDVEGDLVGKERRQKMCLEEMAGRFGDVRLRYGVR